MDKQEAAKVLQVDINSTQEEIHKAFKRRSKVHHPDVGGSHENFTQLRLAQDVLLGKDKPIPETSAAQGELVNAFTAVLGKIKDFNTTNLVERVMGHLANEKVAMARTISNMGEEMDNTKNIIHRLSFNGENDILGIMMQTHLIETERAMDTAKVRVKNLEEAMRIITLYKYTVDEPTNNLSGGVYSGWNILYSTKGT